MREYMVYTMIANFHHFVDTFSLSNIFALSFPEIVRTPISLMHLNLDVSTQRRIQDFAQGGRGGTYCIERLKPLLSASTWE